jgi:hypothetical protein
LGIKGKIHDIFDFLNIRITIWEKNGKKWYLEAYFSQLIVVWPVTAVTEI